VRKSPSPPSACPAFTAWQAVPKGPRFRAESGRFLPPAPAGPGAGRPVCLQRRFSRTRLEQQLETRRLSAQGHHAGALAPSPSGGFLHLEQSAHGPAQHELQTRRLVASGCCASPISTAPRNRSGACESHRGRPGLRWVRFGTARRSFQSEPPPLYDPALARLALPGKLLSLPCSRGCLGRSFKPPRRMVALFRSLPRRSAIGTKDGASPAGACGWRRGGCIGLNWLRREAGRLDGPTLSVMVLRRAELCGLSPGHGSRRADPGHQQTVLREPTFWHSPPRSWLDACLERRPPTYWAVPRSVRARGERLAKRSGAEGDWPGVARSGTG